MKEIFDSKKGKDILIYLLDNKNSYGSKISMDLRITFTHTLKIINFLKNKRYITLKKEGRIRFVQLTNKGKDIAIKLAKIN